MLCLTQLLCRIKSFYFICCCLKSEGQLISGKQQVHGVYCFWLDKQSNDLVLPWASAMKASISSTVRGTHVSSSIPLAVTAMSSSIRTCYREHTVTGIFWHAARHPRKQEQLQYKVHFQPAWFIRWQEEQMLRDPQFPTATRQGPNSKRVELPL